MLVLSVFYILFLCQNKISLANEQINLTKSTSNILKETSDFYINNQQKLNLTNYPGQKCNRQCNPIGKPRICYFEFVMELYHAMGPACQQCSLGVLEDCFKSQCITGDGIEKGVLSINRQIPGPPIHVCKDDLIVVDVVNKMSGEASTIHWHGIHQKESPYMDGVPYITQCPISFANTFRYTFKAKEPGTHFYHSHSGHQKANGIYGPFIVRQPNKFEPNIKQYSKDLPEHIILISDWMHQTAEMMAPGLPKRFKGINPDSILINGHGQYLNQETKERTNLPLTKYFVEASQTYRFRIINSGCHSCLVKVQIQNHRMTVIGTDANPIKPVTVDSIYSSSGERFDVVVKTDQIIGDYLIRIRALGECASQKIEQFAILSYKSNDNLYVPERNITLPDFDDIFPEKVTLNNILTEKDNKKNIYISDLESFQDDTELRLAMPDVRLRLKFNMDNLSNDKLFKKGNYQHFINSRKNITLAGTINGITFTSPEAPLLTQPEAISQEMLCNAENKPKNCYGEKVCYCSHRIKVPLNAIVEIVLLDNSKKASSANHPIHLHGYSFLVTDMRPQSINTTLHTKLSSSKEVSKAQANSSNCFKDTISLPNRGYIKLRFRADNPGYWMLHCHYEWHLYAGMALVMQVGDHNEMKKTPSQFPKCGNYVPDIEASLLTQYDLIN